MPDVTPERPTASACAGVLRELSLRGWRAAYHARAYRTAPTARRYACVVRSVGVRVRLRTQTVSRATCVVWGGGVVPV